MLSGGRFFDPVFALYKGFVVVLMLAIEPEAFVHARQALYHTAALPASDDLSWVIDMSWFP